MRDRRRLGRFRRRTGPAMGHRISPRSGRTARGRRRRTSRVV
jgi:hypothetical protein